MKPISQLLVLLAAIPSVAQADGPLISTWVELRIGSCMPATFEAPLYDTPLYIKGDSYRTALITGDVIDSGLGGYDHLREYKMSEKQIRDEVERTTVLLPRKNSSLNVVLREWDAEFCQKTQGKVVRFNFNGDCDTVPYTKRCLPPVHHVDPTG